MFVSRLVLLNWKWPLASLLWRRAQHAQSESVDMSEDAMVRALVGERIAPLEPSLELTPATTAATSVSKRERLPELVLPEAAARSKSRRRLTRAKKIDSVSRKYAECSPEEQSEASESVEKRLLHKPERRFANALQLDAQDLANVRVGRQPKSTQFNSLSEQ